MDKPASVFVFYDGVPNRYRGIPDTWRFARRGVSSLLEYRGEDMFTGDISTRKIMTDFIEQRFNGFMRTGVITRYIIRINCEEPLNF